MTEPKTFMDEIAFEPEPEEYVAPTKLGLVVSPRCHTSEEFDRVMPNRRDQIPDVEFDDQDENHFNREKKE